jgi:hypothetical protein
MTYAGWLSFDAWAAHWTGLNESKFDWAVTEHQIQQETDLHDLANDKFTNDVEVRPR